MSRGGNPRIAQSPGTQGEEGSAVPPAGSSWGRRSATDPLGARQGVAEDRGPPAATAQMIPPRHSGRAPHKRPVPRTSSHPGTKSRQPQPCPGSGPSLPTHPQFARPRALPTSSTNPPRPADLWPHPGVGRDAWDSPDTCPHRRGASTTG